MRDRPIVFVLPPTGLRREKLLRLDLDQLEPQTPEGLQRAHRAQTAKVQGQGKTQRTVLLSAGAPSTLADYLTEERLHDAMAETTALLLSAQGLPARATDGRFSLRATNLILDHIGRWHYVEITDLARPISLPRPHDLRHTFAFNQARTTGTVAYGLERCLGLRSWRNIQRYTNPPERAAAGCVGEF